MSANDPHPKKAIFFTPNATKRRRVMIILILLALLIGGGVWAYNQYFAPKETPAPVVNDTPKSPIGQPVEQTEENKVESKTTEYLANGDTANLKSYYQTLIAGTSDKEKQAGLYLKLAQALLIPYPDTERTAILEAAYKAEELHPTATTADFIAVLEERYGNTQAATRYRTLYNERYQASGAPEGE